MTLIPYTTGLLIGIILYLALANHYGMKKWKQILLAIPLIVGAVTLAGCAPKPAPATNDSGPIQGTPSSSACHCGEVVTVTKMRCWAHTYYSNGADKMDDIPCPVPPPSSDF